MSQARRIVLARHGSTSWTGRRFCGRTDLPLTPRGRREARALAGWLAAELPEGVPVVSSPLLRCAQTAQIVARQRAVPVDPRLREIDFGAAEGLTARGLRRAMPEVVAAMALSDPRVDWPQGERWAEFEERITAAWRDLLEGGGDRVVVTHGVPARLMLELALGANSRQARRMLGPAHAVELVERRRWRLERTWPPAEAPKPEGA